MKIGELIKQYRESHPQKNGRPMSQRAFAERAGLSNGYISMLEIGINPNTNEVLTPTMTVIKKIAHAMDLTVHALMSQVEDLSIDISAVDSSDLPHIIHPTNNVPHIPMSGVAAGDPLQQFTAAALSIAARYDRLSPLGQQFVEAAISIEEQRELS